jgi:glutamate-1-semialdehyde 2,1-aminomutase
MKHRDHTRLLESLGREYERRSPRSAALQARALRCLVDGGSHTLRLVQPFPPRIAAAGGAYVTDEDGHRILDFWQGHYANLLGHNPPELTSTLAQGFASGFGLQTGFTDRLQVETAELLCRRTGAERARFTTSGSLATMYAVLLARASTGRDRIMKVGGGWHGAQPWGLKGVDFHDENHSRFQHMETKGLPGAIEREVLVTRFNDPEMLEAHFRRHGDGVACFILEPFMGAGGFIPADREYLSLARELCTRYGAVLIFDEVISGFRFHPGAVSQLYGVQPDLSTFAKAIGGGMPVAAVAGRAELLALAGRGGGVKFTGGTYSAHPASLLAARVPRAGDLPAPGRAGGALPPRRGVGLRRGGPARRVYGRRQRGGPRQLPGHDAFPLPGRHALPLPGGQPQPGHMRRGARRHGHAAGPAAGGRVRGARSWRAQHHAHGS